MSYLIYALIIGAGAWLLIQGIKHSNRKRSIVGVAIMTVTLAFFVLVTLRGERLLYETLGLEKMSWLNLAIQTGAVIAKATAAVALTLLIIWSMQSRLFRRVAVLAIALGGAWWWAESRSEFRVFIHRVATMIADTVFG
jgi:hypothetical protein